MPTTLQIPSFSPSNIRERSVLSQAVVAGATSVLVESVEGYDVGDNVYVGPLSREGCELAVIASISAPDELTFTSPLINPHLALDQVTSVVGPRIRVYRAPNVDDTVPADDAFTVLATRSIDPDQETTYYTDSSGSAQYWYRFTYFDEVTLAETPLDDLDPVRGDDFGHYASLRAIRSKAGFENASRLSDVKIDEQRRIAESQINARLGGYMTVPFKPVPEIIKTITILLAAGLLRNDAYGQSSKAGNDLILQANNLMDELVDGASSTGDPANPVIGVVSGYPDDDEERLFHIGDVY